MPADLSIVCNINIGHAQPHCMIPFGVEATVDIDNQVIKFANRETIIISHLEIATFFNDWD